MSAPFKAYRIHSADDTVSGRLETLTVDDLTPGNVVVRVEYSGINYKDALAATGAGRILRRFPLVGGVDLAGEVVSSGDSRFQQGDKVVALCGGLSETCDGGYAQYARVDASMLVPLPDTLTTREAMAIGTAGFTAALAIYRLEQNNQRPESGPIIVTGATGGVGSFAIDMLSTAGYEVVALTGKVEATDYLTALGATRVLDRNRIELRGRPLEHAQWAGAVDNLGGDVLAWLTRTTQSWGNIASIGLAASASLETTVLPFILRAVSILGVNMELDAVLRAEIWSRLASDLRPRHIDTIVTRELALKNLPGCFELYLSGQALGRTVVRIG
jgi:acrylyl-CoA reductase (NADPH)